jgi:hypothetical protein
MPETVDLATFSRQLHTRFRVMKEDGGAVEVELIEASDRGSSPRHEQFSIVFLGPPDAPLPQLTYRIEHDAMGAMDLFLVPIGRDERGFSYEAVFNRPRAPR